MVMRFDQIGSAQNVQQVGQGEAYVQDKYENPLLGVGKMTASLAQANRKAQIAAAKANQEKYKMLDVKPGSTFASKYIKAKADEAFNAFNIANPNDMQKAYQLNFLAKTAAENSLAKEVEIKALNSAVLSNPDDFDVEKTTENVNNYTGSYSDKLLSGDESVLTTNINNLAVPIIRTSKVQDRAKALGTNLEQDFKESTLLNGGIATEKEENVVKSKFDDAVELDLKSTELQNRYRKNLRYDIKNKLVDDKYYVSVDTEPTDGTPVFKNEKGDMYVIDEKAYIKDSYKKDLATYTDSKLIKSFSQAYIPNKFVGADGSGATKDSAFNNGVGNFVVTKTNNDGGSAIGSTTGPLTYFYNPKPAASIFTIGSDGTGKVVNNPGDNKTYPDAKLNQGDNAQFSGLVFVPKTKNGTELNSDVFVVSKDGKTIDKVATLEKLKKLRELGYEFDPNELGAFAQVQVIDKATSQWLSANGETAAESAIVDKMKGNIGSKLLIPISSPNGVNAVSRVYGSNYSIANITKSNPNAVELQKLVKYAQENYSPDQTKIKANKDKQVQIRTRNEAVKEWNTMVGTKKTGNFKNFDEYYKSKTGGKTTPKPKPDNNSPI